MILAEANQWPADVRPYFGDGDECHMAFHFPLMPRIYMALRQEDRLPITDIMAQTPDIPDNCQWGLFLRNHDELTLEMVTDDERDYMYLAYSADPRMRINVGIRRRLAPLVDNNRRRIELLNSLLLSFPGTPILYYGDEIGMGDNIYLGDRNGVRTPMQWNSDRNAGFSKCDPARLYFPVVMDPIYGYQVVNVEAQLSDQSSLLHWTRNMIALRKLFHVFGRGKLEFLHPENRKILAYLRKLENEDGSAETVLCVANLSRFAQPVSLDLAEYVGMMPVEMLGYVSFPPITQQPYPLTVAPYSFLWFELQPQSITSGRPPEEQRPLQVEETLPSIELLTEGWAALTRGAGATLLEAALTAWLVRQRWFGAKSKTIEGVHVVSYASIPTTWAMPRENASQGSSLPDAASLGAAIFFVQVSYRESETETYQLPIALGSGRAVESITADFPASVIASLVTSVGPSVLYDASFSEGFRQSVLSFIEKDQSVSFDVISGKNSNGESGSDEATNLEGAAFITLRGHHSTSFLEVRGDAPLPGKVNASEQSNTSIFFDQKMIMKLFRKLQPGENPDIEIGRFLTEVAHFPRIATFLGEISQAGDDNQTSTALLQELVPNEGDCWLWTLEELARFYESVATCPPPSDAGMSPDLMHDVQPSSQILDHAGLYLEAAALLGRRTAEMHLALATETEDEAFKREPLTSADLQADAQRVSAQFTLTFDALKARMATLSDEVAGEAGAVLSHRTEILSQAHEISTSSSSSGERIRIHGDYHLGQLLRAKNDFVILDFEGEPARPIEERRRKQCPLKDVAGMLRSFSYAAWSGLDQYVQRHPDRRASVEQWTRLWKNTVSSEFLKAYWHTASQHKGLLPERAQSDTLLNGYLLEKALYELLYELNNRPTWVRIPLDGILELIHSSRPALTT